MCVKVHPVQLSCVRDESQKQMIRRLLIITGGVTAIFAGVGLLSYVRQFGYVGSWQSVGLRNGTLTYVTRLTPISDEMGFFVDDVSAVNRAMYYINMGAQWWQWPIWPWVEGILAAVAYSLIVPPIRRLWKHPAPRRLIGVLTAACVLLAALWATSHLATVTYDRGQVHLRLADGAAVLFIDSAPPGKGIPWGTGWNAYRGIGPLKVGFEGIIRFSRGNYMLRAPLGALIVILVVPTIVLARTDRRAWPDHCRRCAYDLTGNESGVCPECGSPAPMQPCMVQLDAPPS